MTYAVTILAAPSIEAGISAPVLGTLLVVGLAFFALVAVASVVPPILAVIARRLS